MTSLIAVTISAYLISSIAVGISFYAFLGERIGLRYNRLAFFGLLVVFAILDMYWVPAIIPLDMTVSFGSKEVVSALELESEIRVNDIIDFGWFDVDEWLVQTIIGYFVGMKTYERIVKRTLTSASGGQM